jgi:hypothetical protein
MWGVMEGSKRGEAACSPNSNVRTTVTLSFLALFILALDVMVGGREGGVIALCALLLTPMS